MLPLNTRYLFYKMKCSQTSTSEKEVIMKVWWGLVGIQERLRKQERQEVRRLQTTPLRVHSVLSLCVEESRLQGRESDWPPLSFQPGDFLTTPVIATVFWSILEVFSAQRDCSLIPLWIVILQLQKCCTPNPRHQSKTKTNKLFLSDSTHL